jgi:hypothetical protein
LFFNNFKSNTLLCCCQRKVIKDNKAQNCGA